ncbi:hypothetical protein BGX24_012408 [Mortierella sp. AD032]|nr:hypothetical protein BGX24_012408 [Mortierella sp. AD032]
MDGVDCDWCLVCDKHTNNGATYCSADCRSTDLISSSASSSSSSASSASSTESSYFSMTDVNGAPLPGTSSSSFLNDNYPMPPFIRKQRTSIPNIYHHCTSNPNQPTSPRFTPNGGGAGSSALSHHLQLQQQQQQPSTAATTTTSPGAAGQKEVLPNSAASQYPLFYATLNALRPITPSGTMQEKLD